MSKKPGIKTAENKLRRPQVNWDAVDLSRPTPDLVAEFGLTKQAVHSARKRRGLAAPDTPGGYRGPAAHKATPPLSREAIKHLKKSAATAGLSPSRWILSR